MKPHLNAHRATLVAAMLALSPLAGCGDGSDEAAEVPASEALDVPVSAALDGVGFEVHRDPG